ncbi:MAG: DNA repair protein RecO [Rhodocyclaceae bacterium]|nr:DNA repair protein RecO [Rhodocyclaceae bacterium]
MSGRKRVDGQGAYVLHTHPYSESSLVVEVLTRDHGRLALVAKGARRPMSSLRGRLMAFQPLEIGWFGGGEVKTLAKADWRGVPGTLRGRSLLVGYYLNELLLKLLPREDPHPGVFHAYGETLGALGGPANDAVVLRRFEKALLQELGYGLTLETEAGSGRPVDPLRHYRYVIERGPVQVSDEGRAGGEEDEAVLGKTLLDLASGVLDDPRSLGESRALMRRLLAHYLGGQALQSRRVFMELQDF